MNKVGKFIILAFITAVSWLPLRVHYCFSSLLYFFLYKVFKYRLTTVVTNISRAFPEIDYKEVNRVAKGFYRSLCDIIVESIWAYTRSSERVAKLLDFGGVEVLNEVYGEGKNVLVLLGHQGNWELYTSLPDLKKHYGLKMDNSKFHYIYKKMSSPLSDGVLYAIRSKHHGCVLVEKGSVVRKLLENKETGGVYYFIADQFPGKNNGTEMAFLNQPTKMFNGPEELARRLSLPVLYFDVERVKRGEYRSSYIKICDNAAETEVGYVTQEYAKLLEESINRNRSNWLWSHKRWKKIK